MKKLSILIVFLEFVTMGCNNEDCRTCSGTMTNTGDQADWTVCDDNGNVIRTNNITGVSEESTNSLPQAVAFMESIGLTCEK